MASNKIFEQVPVKIPNRSGFDCSHKNLFTAKVGTLVPALINEVLPNDVVSLGVASQIQLPPMATDFYGNVKAKFEAFFVPNRILYAGWQDFMTSPLADPTNPSSIGFSLPTLNLTIADCGSGSLADYLGLKIPNVTIAGQTTFNVNNPLPFFAYHKIYEDWYRDSRLQKSVFSKSNTASPISRLPYVFNVGSQPQLFDTVTFNDGSKITSLRQRNFPRDYFTNATAKPQTGNEASLTFDTSGATGGFSIAQLRAANSLQQFLERNNIAGARYGDQIRAQFGIYPSDAVTQRPIYLGSQTVDVYNKSVYQSAQDGATTQSPFDSVGAKFASSNGVGSGSLIDNYKVTEHGFIFVMFSLIPEAIYSTGSHRMFRRSDYGDFAFPILAGVGDQEIFQSELTEGYGPLVNNVFGYTQRYSEYKFMLDELHGLLRDGESLESFALQRSFNGTSLTIGSSFIQIPTNYLDQVTAVSGDASNYGCWVDSYFKYFKSCTLPAYSIPTLGDMQNTHTEVIPNGGVRL